MKETIGIILALTPAGLLIGLLISSYFYMLSDLFGPHNGLLVGLLIIAGGLWYVLNFKEIIEAVVDDD